MRSAINEALATADRSYFAASSAVKAAAAGAGDVYASPGGGDRLPLQRNIGANASEQLKYFTGWVYSAVNAIASRIAGCQWHVGTLRAGHKEPKPLDTHPLIDLLNDPNDVQIAWSLWYFTICSLELTGRSLWWITELPSNDGGKREQILPIPSSWITGTRGSIRFESFIIRPPTSAEEFEIAADEACFIFYPSPSDPREAMSPLSAAAHAVLTDQEIQRSQLNTFKNGIFPRHALIVGKTVGPDGSVANGQRPRLSGAQRKSLIRSVLQIYRGTTSGDPLILDGLIEDIKRLSSTPSEMDWTQSSALVKERITQAFGVSPIILGQIEGANRASSLAAEQHLASTLRPKLRLIQDTISEWLCPRWQMPGGKLKFWFDPFAPRDDESRRAWAGLLAQHSALSYDELRALSPLGLGPMSNGMGSDLIEHEPNIGDTVSREVSIASMAALGQWQRMQEQFLSGTNGPNARAALNGHAKP